MGALGGMGDVPFPSLMGFAACVPGKVRSPALDDISRHEGIDIVWSLKDFDVWRFGSEELRRRHLGEREFKNGM